MATANRTSAAPSRAAKKTNTDEGSTRRKAGMSLSRSSPVRAPIPSVVRSPLRTSLDETIEKLNSAVCVLHCALETINSAADVDVDASEDLSRGLCAARQAHRTIDGLGNRFDEISLRIAHEGIKAEFGPKRGDQ